MLKKEEISTWFQGLQDSICEQLKAVDNSTIIQDLWERPEGGGGRSRVLNGRIIEKGGVNFSAVEGPLPDKIAAALKVDDAEFFATGVSIVLHPLNPHVPIIHMNVRYFELDSGIWWFGGGIDLTPHYIDKDQAAFFHQTLKDVCDKADKSFYPKFKTWADDYFYIRHRKETRGIGGIFFDRLGNNHHLSKDELWIFVQNVGETFAPLYLKLAQEKHELPFTEEHKNWQAMRRGRYVEFNLVWDKGTKFGLDTDGRTESILMSMPPVANWRYNYIPKPNSAEAATQALLKKGIDWATKANT